MDTETRSDHVWSYRRRRWPGPRHFDRATPWINASGLAAPTGGADAHESLAKVLAYAGAEIVHDACARISISRDMMDEHGQVSDVQIRGQIGTALERLASHAARRFES